jgi:hypothetical protein
MHKKVVRKPHIRKGYVRRDGTRVRATKVRGTAYLIDAPNIQRTSDQNYIDYLARKKEISLSINKFKESLEDLTVKDIKNVAGHLLTSSEKRLKKKLMIKIIVNKLTSMNKKGEIV